MKTPPPSENGSLPPVPHSRGRESELREQEIHRLLSERTLARKKRPALPMWNCTTLGKEMGYSRQCIASTVAHMIRKGYPIAHTSTKHLYYKESFTPMLAQVITESGLTRLFFAIRAIEALQDCPVYAPVLTDLQKLVSALIERLGVDYTVLSACLTIKHTSIDPFVDPEMVEKLITAIRERQELEIIYSKLNYESGSGVGASVPDACDPSPSSVDCPPMTAPTPPTSDLCPPTSSSPTIPHPNAPWLPLHVETRTAHPLHIYCLDNVWYLYLWDPMRKALRRFVLSRMHSIRRTGETFKPRRFNVKKLISNRLGITSGDPVKVRLQFRNKASYLVAERPWFDSQELAPGPDSEWNLELTTTVALTPELLRWIFGFDQDARVIEPSELRDAVAKRTEGMRAIYGSLDC